MADLTNEGINAFGALTDQARKAAAYGVAKNAFGALIADPDYAKGVSEAQVSQATAPLNIQRAQQEAQGNQALITKYGPEAGSPQNFASDTKTADEQNNSQREAGFRAIQMLKTQVDPTTGSVSGDAFDHVVGSNSKLLGLDDAHVGPLRDMLTAPGGAAHLDTVGQALIGPTQVTGAGNVITNPDGTNSVVRFDKFGHPIKTDLGGQTVQQENSNINKAKLPYVAENAAAHTTQAQAAAYTAGIGGQGGAVLPGDNRPSANRGGGNTTAPASVDLIGAGPNANQVSGPGIAPVARRGMASVPYSDGSGYAMVPVASVPKTAAGQQTVVNKDTGQIEQRTVQMTHSAQDVAVARADLGQMDLQYGRTVNVLNKAMDQVGPMTTGYGGRASEMLGTPARAALDASIQTAKSNIALLTANIARQGNKGGASAVPVRNMQEFKAYQDALGAITPNASASVVRQQIQTAQQALQALQQGVHAKYAATYGDGVHAPAAAPQTGGAPAGWSIRAVP